MQSVNAIRGEFLKYFKENDHNIAPSSALVPDNDPSLLFTNAGMVQFKNMFLNAGTDMVQRVATSQKCLRAGGKHNDLENVGYTARHHTFFEMLGNFSFGDYFKERAILHAWTLLTKTYGLPEEKLLVTVYHDDDEAALLWKKIAGLSEDRIIRIATSDNFWSMGDTGPCGPCSEIFYDHGEQIAGGPPGSADEDGDRFIEIWNLVFMQYEQLSPDERIALPKPSIDTGMGLERISAVMQGVHDNYDIDLFQNLIGASADICGVAADGEHKTSHRVIADHLRACSFLIADGVMPSNEGRGYVLRRIMRRAMRHAHQMGCEEPVMHLLVPALVKEMGEHFEELSQRENVITETLKREEAHFKQTLDRGLKILLGRVDSNSKGGVLDGATAFELYDTYGFPVDLTQDVLRGYDWSVDLKGFDVAMKKQKTKARQAWSGFGGESMPPAYFKKAEEIEATDFLRERLSAEGKILAIFDGKGWMPEAKSGDEVGVITDKTPFYGESGGQLGDKGKFLHLDNEEQLAYVFNTTKIMGKVFVHHVEVNQHIEVGDPILMKVNKNYRQFLKCNHSATHLLHQALRDILGNHVEQKGSLVAHLRLRFDFSHPQPVSADELAMIEEEVNNRIVENSNIEIEEMSHKEAIAKGAMALFGEKYGDEVRVVSMGLEGWSKELCGGTHVTSTGAVGSFKITSEEGVSSGIRRIEAVTSVKAKRLLGKRDAILKETAAILKTTPEQVFERVKNLVEQRRKDEQSITGLRKKVAEGIRDVRFVVNETNTELPIPTDTDNQNDSVILEKTATFLKTTPEQVYRRVEALIKERDENQQIILTLFRKATEVGGANTPAEHINGIIFEKRLLDDTPAKELKSIAEGVLKSAEKTIVAVVGRDEGKASIVVAVSKDLTKNHDAVELVRIGVESLGGKGGGGRADMAQGGGSNPEAGKAALEAIAKKLGE